MGWLAAFVGYVLDYYEVALNNIIIVPIRTDLNVSLSLAAVIPGTILLFLAVGGVFFGWLGDRIGRRNVLYFTIITYAVGTIARAVTYDYTWLLVWTAITGLGLGGEFGVGQTLVSELAPVARRGLWGAAFYASGAIGILLSAAAGILLLPTIGWRMVFLISGVASLGPLAFRLWTPESGTWERKKKEAMGAIIWSRVFLVPFFMCLCIGILEFYKYYLVSATLPLYLTAAGLTIAGASYYVFVSGAGTLTGSLIGAYVNDKIGRRWTGTIGAIVYVIFGFALFLLGRYIATNPAIMVLFYCLGIGSSMSACVLGVLFSEQFPTKVRSLGTSATNQIARGLAFFPPIIAAAIFPVYGYGVVFLIGTVLTIAEGLSFWMLKERRGEDLEF
jgi:putative MFS transporter